MNIPEAYDLPHWDIPQLDYNKPYPAVICDMKSSNVVQDDTTLRNSMGFHDKSKYQKN